MRRMWSANSARSGAAPALRSCLRHSVVRPMFAQTRRPTVQQMHNVLHKPASHWSARPLSAPPNLAPVDHPTGPEIHLPLSRRTLWLMRQLPSRPSAAPVRQGCRHHAAQTPR
eukprot:Skav231150  [mRNA]  locus=scaffold4611:102928:103266:+ [translate_table: standard]